jgi:hypothetical protein
MSKTKKSVSKISDKLVKVNENFSVNIYDNGFMFEINGRDTNDEWVNAKIICSDIEQLVSLVREASDMDRSN